MTFVSDLEPRPLFSLFDELMAIPRPSAHEERARAWVRSHAAARGHRTAQDPAGNLVVYLPASPGLEAAPTVILQAHLDMVTEKHSELSHDFFSDPLVPRLDGDHLYATGTTLGADNGVGVAAMVALLSNSELRHGPVELLFTVEEETGLYGALNLDPSLLSGRLLLNLDSEDEGTVTVGCAGGAGCELTLPLVRQPLGGHQLLAVHLSGGRGGHSGIDIHRERVNAIAGLARCLRPVAIAQAVRIIEFSGGDKTNAIPREARALLAVASSQVAQVTTALKAQFAELQGEYRLRDPHLSLTVTPAELAQDPMDGPTTLRLLDLLVGLPHGVHAMSPELPGLVETSSTLAVTGPSAGGQRVHVSCRSSVEQALRAQQARVEAVARLAGAQCEIREGYPGWQPDLSSPLLAELQRVHQSLFGKPAVVCALHAGLECGLLARKLPGLQAISIGPTMRFPHSPEEHLVISSVGRFHALLTGLVERLGQL